MTTKKNKRFFAKHAKSSAALVSLGIHAVIIVLAISFVTVSVIQKDEQAFEAKPVNRPKMQLKKLQVPVKLKKKTQKPKLRKRIVANPKKLTAVDIKMPEITGVKGGMGAGAGAGLGGAEAIGFTMPEINFFGAKAKGEKIVFVVHFGPQTMSAGKKKDANGKEQEHYTPFSRMTGLTIRNRLADLVDTLPAYTLFNVMAYFAGDAWAMEPKMQLATPANKQKVKDWMEPVNPLEGEYDHCFAGKPNSVGKAYKNYPTKVDNLPFYATKWCWPYYVPTHLEEKYAPDAPGGFKHWGRGVAWALLEQKPDTIFVLTTNYIDGWSVNEKESKKKGIPQQPDQPRKMAKALAMMCLDVYGLDKKTWPTINVVVLAKAGKDTTRANQVLSGEFGPIIKTFKADGTIINDITKHMNADEKKLYREYQAKYANK